MTTNYIDVPRNGEVAGNIRQLMKDRGWTVPDLNEKLGMKRSAANVYGWIKAKGAPGAEMQKRLAKLTGTKASDWAPNEAQSAPKPGQEIVRVYPPREQKPQPDILSFTVSPEGAARIRLDVTLPVQMAMPLVRMLLDQGLIVRDSSNGRDDNSNQNL
jgi:transcriptional regulator with XRE-family HTH domain